MYKYSTILLLLVITLLKLTVQAVDFIYFVPYLPTDNKCSGPVSGFGFALPVDTCVGCSDLSDLPGSYYAQSWNSSSVQLSTYINIEYTTDCSGNPTSEFVYNFEECTYDWYEGKFDETNYRYMVYNNTEQAIPENSILYQVYDKKCEFVESYYYLTNGTYTGYGTDFPVQYICENDLPTMVSCQKGKCSSYNIASKCGQFDYITVSCASSSK